MNRNFHHEPFALKLVGSSVRPVIPRPLKALAGDYRFDISETGRAFNSV